jgi:hypothetical protein
VRLRDGGEVSVGYVDERRGGVDFHGIDIGLIRRAGRQIFRIFLDNLPDPVACGSLGGLR